MGQIVYDGLGNPVGIAPRSWAIGSFARGALRQRPAWQRSWQRPWQRRWQRPWYRRWQRPWQPPWPQGSPPLPYTGTEPDALQQEQPWQPPWPQGSPPLPYTGTEPDALQQEHGPGRRDGPAAVHRPQPEKTLLATPIALALV